MVTDTVFEKNLEKNEANYQALTPLSYLERSAFVYPDSVAVIHGEQQFSYRQFYERCRRLASALSRLGVGVGDTVAIMSPNTPPMLEAHYGVPMCGAVLNALNYRLDADTIAFILGHGEARVVLTDTEFSDVMSAAIAKLDSDIVVVDIDDPQSSGGRRIAETSYEQLLQTGDPEYDWRWPEDEWTAISLNYTSGTTGNPKGVVYHHRGAFLNAIGNAMTFGLNADSVYLWTLPMFHCNGWTYTWGVTAVGGTHVCLRSVDPGPIFAAIRDHGVTHMCGAPIVLNMLVYAPDSQKTSFPQTVQVATGGAAPPSSVISSMQNMGFSVTHLYGLTETYGPATVCEWQQDWEQLDEQATAVQMSRQGVRYATLEGLMMADSESMQPVPRDGETIGELMLRGNTVMRGYLKNPQATDEAFRGGWFHTGDLGVMHPNGYIEIKDRSKDIIISGGENISSLEIEDVLYRHPDVLEAAVVAKPDEKWGETPCAFVSLTEQAQTIDHDQIQRRLEEFCRENLAGFKVPRTFIFGPLPKTSTGKIQKFVLREAAM